MLNPNGREDVTGQIFVNKKNFLTNGLALIFQKICNSKAQNHF